MTTEDESMCFLANAMCRAACYRPEDRPATVELPNIFPDTYVTRDEAARPPFHSPPELNAYDTPIIRTTGQTGQDSMNCIAPERPKESVCTMLHALCQAQVCCRRRSSTRSCEAEEEAGLLSGNYQGPCKTPSAARPATTTLTPRWWWTCKGALDGVCVTVFSPAYEVKNPALELLCWCLLFFLASAGCGR